MSLADIVEYLRALVPVAGRAPADPSPADRPALVRDLYNALQRERLPIPSWLSDEVAHG